MTAATETLTAASAGRSEAFRWGGLSMAVGGVLVGLFPLLHPAHDTASYAGSLWAPIHLVPHVGLILVMAGLPRLVLLHGYGRERVLRVGTAVTYVGMALTVAQAMVEAFVFPIWAIESPDRLTGPPAGGAALFMMVGSLAFVVGIVMLGIAVARAPRLPGRAGVLLALGGPAFGLGGAALGLEPVFITGGLLLGGGLFWLGLALAEGREQERTTAT